MTDERDLPDDPRDLAAEYALGVLTGDELARAGELMRADPSFREQVGRWQGRLAAMLEEVAPVEAPARAWTSIEQRLARPPQENGNVVLLRRRLNQWRGIAAAMSALAACLTIVLVAPVPAPLSKPPVEVRGQPVEPLVAMLGNDDREMKVVASWDPAARQLVLAVAGQMSADPAHSHELWVIPADGKPRSLGILPDNRSAALALDQRAIGPDVVLLAISLEPKGGSPDPSGPTGPVLYKGSWTRL